MLDVNVSASADGATWNYYVVPHDALLGMPRAIFSHGRWAGCVVDKECPPFATSRDTAEYTIIRYAARRLFFVQTDDDVAQHFVVQNLSWERKSCHAVGRLFSK